MGRHRWLCSPACYLKQQTDCEALVDWTESLTTQTPV